MRYVFSLQETNFREPVTRFTESQLSQLDLKYYNPEVHKAAFVLPQFAKKVTSSSY